MDANTNGKLQNFLPTEKKLVDNIVEVIISPEDLSIYLGFYVTFNTVQVMS